MISVIVPTYNDEAYIGKCIESIIGQTYRDFELIVVNDGSTDNTLKIAESYQGRLPRYKVLSQENQGSGTARNHGLEQATGEYIVFVDADDWLEPAALEILINKEEQTSCDYIIAGGIVNEEGKITRPSNKAFYCDDPNGIPKQLLELYLRGNTYAPWAKLFKRSIIEANNIRFPNLRRSQDIVFNDIYMRYIHSVMLCSEAIYNFRINPTIVKDKFSRRNADFIIRAELSRIEVNKVLYNSFIDTMTALHYKLSDNDLIRYNNRFVIGTHDAVAKVLTRGKKTARIFVEKLCSEQETVEHLKNSRNSVLYYRLFARMVVKKQVGIILLYVGLKNALYPLLKNVARRVKRGRI